MHATLNPGPTPAWAGFGNHPMPHAAWGEVGGGGVVLDLGICRRIAKAKPSSSLRDYEYNLAFSHKYAISALEQGAEHTGPLGSFYNYSGLHLSVCSQILHQNSAKKLVGQHCKSEIDVCEEVSQSIHVSSNCSL